MTDHDGTRHWDGTWEHQSTQALVWSLMSRIKSQGVWSREQAWVELMDEENVGGAWLRRQDEPRATFEEMWERAYDRGPKLSFEQVVTVLLRLVDEEPGIRLVALRRAAAGAGWRNRGDLDKLIAAMLTRGDLREERTYGPGGLRCTSRRFWREQPESVAVAAKTTTVALSLGLLAVGSTRRLAGQQVAGQKASEGCSYFLLLTDKKIRAQGLKRLRLRLMRLRPPAARRARRRAAPQQPLELTESERQYVLGALTDSVPMGNLGWNLSCVL